MLNDNYDLKTFASSMIAKIAGPLEMISGMAASLEGDSSSHTLKTVLDLKDNLENSLILLSTLAFPQDASWKEVKALLEKEGVSIDDEFDRRMCELDEEP